MSMRKPSRRSQFEALEGRDLLASVRSGFSQEVLAAGLSGATALQLLPDGRALIAQQGGNLRLLKDGQVVSEPVLSLSVDSRGERGLLGVTVDPNFASNGFVYLYYTVAGETPFNRVSRFTMTGDTVDAASESVLLDQPALGSATSHNGGAMHFANDGTLLIAVGDNVLAEKAQENNSLLGKMLRINSDGTIPSDNPFRSSTTGVNRSIFAKGFRNPFTFAVDRASGRVFVNDVGQTSFEEINELSAGANYGWPNSEGPTTLEGVTAPLFAYGRSVGFAIVGGTFYSPATATFPQEFVGDYFFADFAIGFIKRLDPTTNQVSDFGDEFGNVVDLDVTPQGDMLVLSRSNGGEIIRVSASAPGPVISRQPSPVIVGPGAAATFRVTTRLKAGLTFQWLRNGQPISAADNVTAATSQLRVVATENDNGALYSVRVSNGTGITTSSEAILTVTPNRPAVLKLSAPASTFTYTAGRVISVSGSATDPDTGRLPVTAVSYLLEAIDGDTATTLATSSGKSARFTIPQPADKRDTVRQLRLTATATDSVGATTVVTRSYNPKLVTIRVQPVLPRGTTGQPSYVVDGTSVAPAGGLLVLSSVAGVSRTIELVDAADDDILLRRFPGAVGNSLTISPTANRTIRPSFSAVVIG